jgi:hypothetical protein
MYTYTATPVFLRNIRMYSVPTQLRTPIEKRQFWSDLAVIILLAIYVLYLVSGEC